MHKYARRAIMLIGPHSSSRYPHDKTPKFFGRGVMCQLIRHLGGVSVAKFWANEH